MSATNPAHEFVICRWTPGDPEDEVKLLSRGGVTMIETGYEWITGASVEAIERASRIYAQGGIRIRSIHAPFGENEDLTNPTDAATREKAFKDHVMHLERAAMLGAEYLIVHPGHACKDDADIPKKEALLPSIVEGLLKVAERVHVKVALENMLPKHPCSRCETLVKMKDRFPSPWLSMCFDSGHAHVACGDVLSELKVCGPIVGTYHLHDNDGIRDLHLQPPYGTIHWEKLFNLISETTPSLPLTVEANGWGGMNYRWMMEELKALHSGRCNVPGIRGKATRAVCPECSHLIFSKDGRWVCHCDCEA